MWLRLFVPDASLRRLRYGSALAPCPARRLLAPRTRAISLRTFSTFASPFEAVASVHGSFPRLRFTGLLWVRLRFMPNGSGYLALQANCGLEFGYLTF